MAPHPSAHRATKGVSALWFDPDSIIHGRPDTLLAAEIPFCGLDRDVAKQELYLFQFASRCVAQPRAGPSQVVRRQLFDGGFRGELTDNVPDDLLGDALTPDRQTMMKQCKLHGRRRRDPGAIR